MSFHRCLYLSFPSKVCGLLKCTVADVSSNNSNFNLFFLVLAWKIQYLVFRVLCFGCGEQNACSKCGLIWLSDFYFTSFSSPSSTAPLIVTTQFISLRGSRGKWLHHRPLKITLIGLILGREVISGSVSFQSDLFFFFLLISSLNLCPLEVNVMNKLSDIVFFFTWAQRNMD